MTVVAQLKFRSTTQPRHYGIMALNDDGTFRIAPSDEFRDDMARREEISLQRAKKVGLWTGISLLSLGITALGLGWYIGRIFGKLGFSLNTPRQVKDVKLQRLPGGGIEVTVRGAENRLQSITMIWNADEVLQPEVETFVDKLVEMQGLSC